MRGCRARGRNRVIDSLDLERGGERRRIRARHRLRHFERPHLARPFRARRVGGLNDGARGRAARAHDEAGALVADVLLAKPRVEDGLLHRDVVPGGARPHETAHLAVDHPFPVEVRFAVNLRAKAPFGVILGFDDAGARLAQGGKHLLAVVTDGRDDAHSRDSNTSHV